MVPIAQHVRGAMQLQAWSSAEELPRTTPSTYGFVDDPWEGSRARYIAWFDRHVEPKYESHTLEPKRGLHPSVIEND
ncbi:MAG TPA: hypothetical protein VJV79_21835 [Polyangiaceae bacterium]|nr:hypothetical protein [Polyangiaceae bacterium]